MQIDYRKVIQTTLDQISDEKLLKYICNERLYDFIDIAPAKQSFSEWEQNHSKDEFNLYIKIAEYEHFFDDMLFEKNSIVGKYTYFNGKIHDFGDHLSILNHFFSIHIKEIESDAQLLPENRYMIFHPNSINKKDILLHEMIHAHEIILSMQSPIFKEILIIELHQKLSRQYNDLDKWIQFHCNISVNKSLEDFGGIHDLLFFLKSIDLDYECGYAPFTIMGYDYKENMTRWFSQIQ